MLAATAVTVLLAVPQALWQQFMKEIGASALYVENWALALDAVDYLAADNAASPTQHYWSLSTEEQFYLVWPLLILLAGWLALRAGARRRTVLGAVLVTVVAASFGYSLWATTYDVSSAYFATPARAWEFGLGGLLALFAANPLAGHRTVHMGVVGRFPGHRASPGSPSPGPPRSPAPQPSSPCWAPSRSSGRRTPSTHGAPPG